MNTQQTKKERDYAGAYTFAQRNGYKGSFAEYVTLQYNAYCETCERCGIAPMARAMWDNA